MLKPLKLLPSVGGFAALSLAIAGMTQPCLAQPQPDFTSLERRLRPQIQPLRLEINLNRRRVTLFQGHTLIKSYPIAVGRPGWETPVGEFKVKQMFKDPPWMHPFKGFVIPGGAADNPLGRYWIGFWTDGKNWIGMHGTPNPESVGRAVSHGCIRMYNQDIEELFARVGPGTPVIVKP